PARKQAATARPKSSSAASWADFRSPPRYLGSVLGQPLIERLQRGCQRTGNLQIARSREFPLKVPVVLEHVAEIFCAREPELAIRIRRDVLEAHLRPQRLGKGGGHLCSREVLSGNAHRLANVLAAALEDAVSNLADVFCCDSSQAQIANREWQGE